MTPQKRFLTNTGSSPSATEVCETLYKIPALLTTWTRRGKPYCRCTAGQLHGPYYALHWREGRFQRRRYVKRSEVPAVRVILDRRQAERQRERLADAVSQLTWRQLARLIEDHDARFAELGERL